MMKDTICLFIKQRKHITALSLLFFLSGCDPASYFQNIGIDSKKLLIFFFILSIFALFVLAYFFIKTLFGLYSQYKQKIPGYKIKTKLVTIFVGITLLPTTILFIVASGFLTNYIDKWFTPQISKPLDEAVNLAGNVYKQIRSNTLEDAILISKGVDATVKYAVKRVNTPSEDMSETVKNAFKGNEGTEVITEDEGDIVRAAVPIKRGNKVIGVFIVDTLVSEEIVKSAEDIQRFYKEYVTLKEFKMPLKANYFVIMGVVALFLVLLAFYIAIKLSGSITGPLQQLAHATSKVSEGDLDTTVVYNRDDEIGMLINSFNNMIATIKDAEISLQNSYIESNRRRLYMEHIINNIDSGVISLDIDNRVITINDAACKILNVKVEDVIRKSYTELISHIETDELTKFIKDINLYSFHSKKEQLNVSIDGKDMVLRIFVVQLQDVVLRKDDKRKGALGILVVFDDLTELIQAQKALTWQDVAKRITHEIKNPLTPIKLSAERLLKRWHTEDPNFDKIIVKATGTIIREVDGLQRLVNEFSQLGKMPDILIEYTDIEMLINEVIDLYSEYENTGISLLFNAKSPKARVDAEQVKRVFINIIDNAVQATNHKGEIQVRLYNNEAHDSLVIEIADNGPGIAKEDKEKLFQPYFSRRKNGTGLGLAIAHKIIKGHKGTITVSDNKPKGTIFKLEIPQ